MACQPKVFVDSSVFFTAVNSPSGGSAKIFSLSKSRFNLIVSELVLIEVERNVRKKLPEELLERFFFLVKECKILKQKLNKQLIKKAQKVIVKKDAIILAEVKQAKTDYLLTLDRKHFINKKVEEFIKPTQVVMPKQLLKGL